MLIGFHLCNSCVRWVTPGPVLFDSCGNRVILLCAGIVLGTGVSIHSGNCGILMLELKLRAGRGYIQGRQWIRDRLWGWGGQAACLVPKSSSSLAQSPQAVPGILPCLTHLPCLVTSTSFRGTELKGRGSNAWALTLVEGPASMTLTAPVWPSLLPREHFSAASCLTHPVPPGKEDGRSCKKVTIRMTIRKNDCRSSTPVRGPRKAVGGRGAADDGDGGLWGMEATQAASLGCPSPGEPSVLRWEVSVCQHLQLQHQHLRPLLQVLPRGGPAAAFCAALLCRQRHLGALRSAGAHGLCLPVVLRPAGWGGLDHFLLPADPV